MDLNYKVEEIYGVISENNKQKKMVANVSWNDRPAKKEIRTWVKKPEGEIPTKGMTFTDEEWKKFMEIASKI